MSVKMRQRGFTLMELLVVMAAMGVLSSIMTTVWFQVMNANRTSQVRAKLERDVHNAFMDMRADFDSALSPALARAPLAGVSVIDAEVEERRGPLVTTKELPSDSVTFDTRRPDVNGLMTVERVTYRIDRPEDGDATLVRAVAMAEEDGGGATEDGAETANERVGEVLRGVTAMRLEYLSDGAWVEAWSEETNPEAVRVSLLAMVPSSAARADVMDEAVARVAVFPLHTR